MTHEEAVAPYLLDEHGEVLRDALDNDPFVDALVDQRGGKLCGICIQVILEKRPELTCGLAFDHHPKVAWKGKTRAPRVWWFCEKLPPDVVLEFDSYLASASLEVASAACRLDRHARHEARVLRAAKQDLLRALEKVDEIEARAPGWSMPT